MARSRAESLKEAAVEAVKPRLRGVLHQYAFFVALVAGAVPQLAHAIGAVGVSLILGGGILYTAGAVIYALRRPNPVPGVFGYHEVFHALVVAAAVAHFTAVAVYALPAHVG